MNEKVAAAKAAAQDLDGTGIERHEWSPEVRAMAAAIDALPDDLGEAPRLTKVEQATLDRVMDVLASWVVSSMSSPLGRDMAAAIREQRAIIDRLCPPDPAVKPSDPERDRKIEIGRGLGATIAPAPRWCDHEWNHLKNLWSGGTGLSGGIEYQSREKEY